MGTGDLNAGVLPCNGLASSYPGRSSKLNIPCCFMLQKPEFKTCTGLMGCWLVKRLEDIEIFGHPLHSLDIFGLSVLWKIFEPLIPTNFLWSVCGHINRVLLLFH